MQAARATALWCFRASESYMCALAVAAEASNVRLCFWRALSLYGLHLRDFPDECS